MMSKQTTLACLVLTLFSATAAAQDNAAQYAKIASGVTTFMSPSGNYVVGNASNSGTDMFSSFVYQPDTKTLTWSTSYTEDDLDKSGRFLAVNDNGDIAGAIKDKDLVKEYPATDWNDAYTVTFTSAAVWRNGTLFRLGLGTRTIDELSDEFDGSYARAISSDGKTVAGYIYKGYVESVPCGWTWNATTNSYDYFEYSMPTASALGTITALSADGRVAVGRVSYGGCSRPVVWTSPDSPKEITLGVATENIWSAAADAVSSDGTYVLVHINSGKSPRLAVHNTQDGQTIEVPLSGVYDIQGLCIDNAGNFFCKITDNKSYAETTYYYSASTATLVTMEYFMQTYAGTVGETAVGNTSTPVAMSADGSAVAGHTLQSGYGTAWWLQADKSGIVAPGADGVKFFATRLSTAAVTFKPAASTPAGLTLLRYDVFCDNAKVQTVAASDAAATSVVRCDVATTEGKHSAYVVAAYDSDGKEVLSAPSQAVSLSVPDSYALPMTDNFESQGLDENCWSKELVKGNTGEILAWNVSGGDFENNTYFANVTTISSDPYEATLTSHFFDATASASPYVVFYVNMTYVNAVQTNLGTDFLDIEATTDGENWTAVGSVAAADAEPYKWNFYQLGLTQYAGRPFALRFKAHGEGKAQLRWAIDYVTAADTMTETAPEGLTAKIEGGTVRLDWKNSAGLYEASYLANSNVIPDYNVGNAGADMLSAVDFTPDSLAAYAGKYISTVATFIYDDPSLYSETNTKAEAIIYADGIEVARKAFATGVALQPYTSVTALDTPVKIEEGKTYRVAVRIHDYDSKQSPLYYQADSNCAIAGVTDLYSEDGGNTWSTISEFNKDDETGRAYCVWPIRIGISDVAEAVKNPTFDRTLLAYNVHRNGTCINTMSVYEARHSFVDTHPFSDCDNVYSVQAFYTNGDVSVVSKHCTVGKVTAIGKGIADNAVDVNFSTAADRLLINGDFDNAKLTDAAGHTVASTRASAIDTASLPHGVYVLTVTKSGRRNTYKIAVR